MNKECAPCGIVPEIDKVMAFPQEPEALIINSNVSGSSTLLLPIGSSTTTGL